MNNIRTAWTVAIILGICLVIVLFFLFGAEKALGSFKAQQGQNITATADTVRSDCSSTDPVTHAKCGDDLQNLSDLLAEFSKTLPATAPTTDVPANAIPVGNVSNGQFTPTSK